MLTHSVLSYVIHFIAAFIFVGVLNYPSAKSIITVALISIKSIFQAQNEFLNSVTKGVSLMEQSGIHAVYDRDDTETDIVLTIKIPKTEKNQPISGPSLAKTV